MRTAVSSHHVLSDAFTILMPLVNINWKIHISSRMIYYTSVVHYSTTNWITKFVFVTFYPWMVQYYWHFCPNTYFSPICVSLALFLLIQNPFSLDISLFEYNRGLPPVLRFRKMRYLRCMKHWIYRIVIMAGVWRTGRKVECQDWQRLTKSQGRVMVVMIARKILKL